MEQKDKYYVVSTDSRKVLNGPFDTREEADKCHYKIASQGIDCGDGEVKRPRVAVVIGHALTPNDAGNHFVSDKPVVNEAASGTVKGEYDQPNVVPPVTPGGDFERPGNATYPPQPDVVTPSPPGTVPPSQPTATEPRK